MKKLYFCLFFMFIFMGKVQVNAQVFAYPGATWVFHSPTMYWMCSEVYQSWKYVGDTIILGLNSSKILVKSKIQHVVPPNSWFEASYTRFFHTSGDTVFLFVESDSTWQQIYNFSVQIGDSLLNPLGNKMNIWANQCPDSVPYNDYAIVTDVGFTTIAGESLRYYTVRYFSGWMNDSAYQTYYERIITLDYWYPSDGYWCGGVAECSSPILSCYKDNGMITDLLCDDLTWFEALSFHNETETAFNIYPNPATDLLMVETNVGGINYYDIISLDGKLVMRNTQSPISLTGLHPGIYFLTDKNRTSFSKFIKT